jgi:hypothetical protein
MIKKIKFFTLLLLINLLIVNLVFAGCVGDDYECGRNNIDKIFLVFSILLFVIILILFLIIKLVLYIMKLLKQKK